MKAISSIARFTSHDGERHFKRRSCYGHRMTRFALALCLVACGSRNINDIPVPSQPSMPFRPLPTYPDIAWVDSIPEARARAAEDHKPLLVFVRAAWSQPSVMMESTIWRDARVLSEAPRFVALRVDLTNAYGDPMPESLKDFLIEGVPATVVVATDGHVTGHFAAGAARAADVAKAMHDAN
jgi:thiol:disulfide interchange protein